MSSSPYHSLRVAKIVEETPDARSIVLEVPGELRERFSYRAGQFLTFRVEVGESGKRLVRCYSLSSSPDAENEFKVTVKRVAEGRVSNHLNDHLAVGHVLEVMKPNGHFCLREREAPLLFFGGGSGVTPIISILKSALATTERETRLVYANRDEASIIFRDELRELAARHPGRLHISHRLDDEDGFLDVPSARKHAESARDADFYICGPGPFMDVVEAALKELEITSDRIFIERFEIDEEAVADDSAAERTGGDTASTSPDASASLVYVKLDGQETELRVREGETLLEAARRAGLDAPFSCEDGFCGCCMAKVIEGRVEMRSNDGGVDDALMAEGWVLTCQGLAKTPRVRIQYPD